MLCNASFASSMFGGSAFSQRLPAPALAAIAASGWLISWATAEASSIMWSRRIARQTLALVQEGLGCDVRIESRYRQGRQQEQQRQDAERDRKPRMVEPLRRRGAHAAGREIRRSHAGVVHPVDRRAHDDRAAGFLPECRGEGLHAQ